MITKKIPECRASGLSIVRRYKVFVVAAVISSFASCAVPPPSTSYNTGVYAEPQSNPGEAIDDATLANVALTSLDRKTRLTAIEYLKDPITLEKIAAEYHDYNHDAVDAAALIRLAMVQPVVVEKLPGLRLIVEYTSLSQNYRSFEGQTAMGTVTVTGESVAFMILDGSKLAARGGWESIFPAWTGGGFIWANVDVSGMLIQLFRRKEFTDQDLLKVSESRVEELSKAAVASLRVPASDETLSRLAALRSLNRQKILAETALTSTNKLERMRAVEDTTDQSVIGKVVIEDESPGVRLEAVNKLTDQSVLAKCAVNDAWYYIRILAVGKLLDQALLAEIAAKDPNEDVRQAATHRLSKIRSGQR